MTIENWIRKLGKNELLSRILRVEMKNETDELKKLKKELDKVKIALADERLKVLAYESLIEVADEHFGTGYRLDRVLQWYAKKAQWECSLPESSCTSSVIR